MLAELPVELLGGIVSYGSTKDLFNLRLTSRLLHNSLSEAFGRRFFLQRTHHYTTRSLQLLLEISQSVSIQNALKEMTIVAVEPLYRDDDALQQLLRPQVIGKRAESLWHQNRHHRSTSKPPAFPDVAGFSSDWRALQESINEQCASMLKEALTNLFARAQQTPPMLLLRYEPRKWDGYRYKFDTPAALAQFVGAGDSYLGMNEPVKTLTPILSTASEIGYPIAGIELGRGSHNHHWGVSTFEPLMKVSPSALANLRRLDIALTMTAADLHDDRDEGLRYMMSLSASLAELNITFDHKDRCFLTSEYMTTWAHCVSDAPLTSLSITNGHMSADGLGKLLEPHSGTLRSLQLHYVSFGDDDEPLAMLERLSTFPVLDTLGLIGLARRGTDVAIDMETLGSVFSARGRAAVRELWRKFTECHSASRWTVRSGVYARLWATVSFNQSVPFTTTVSPTPVASSELIFPPALYTACPNSTDTCIDCYKLPEDFVWGVASSAFQIEGGLTEDGRGPGAFDTIGAVGYVGRAPNEADSEVANMAYYLYKQDIARLAAIGIPYFGFSMSWTRIVPFGTVGSPINQAGLDHYEDVIKTCLEYGVKPIVTLTHFDPPLGLQYNSTDFPDAFLYYAKQVMTRFGDRVQEWATLNEPNGVFRNDFPSVPNILMAHAKVYHWYKEELGGTGAITIKFANNLGTPLDNSHPDDVRAALRYQDFILGTFANSIFLGEQYPEEVTSTGVKLTLLTDEELAYINGTADVWSFDPYTTGFVTGPEGGIDACASNKTHPLWPTCVVNTNVQSNGWLNGQGSFEYAYIAPQYVRQQLGYVWNVFKPKGTVVSEFGFNSFMESSKTKVSQQYDLERTLYYQSFLREMLKSIYEDGVNVVGALAWSFQDNNEFGQYDQQYGLQLVNRTNGEFTRSFKRSLFDYVDFFHTFKEGESK